MLDGRSRLRRNGGRPDEPQGVFTGLLGPECWLSHQKRGSTFHYAVGVCVLCCLVVVSTLALSSSLHQPGTHRRSQRARVARFDTSVSRGRGILMRMHNAVVPMGLSLVKELRCLGNQELIQLYHCFPDEMSELSRALLLGEDARLEIVDVCSDLVERGVLTRQVAERFKNRWIKPLALSHTDLVEVLLMDVDDVFMQNPAVLRSTPGYRRTGTAFFYDRAITSRQLKQNVNNSMYFKTLLKEFDYVALGLKNIIPDELIRSYEFKEQDTSLMAIDKSRSGEAMKVLSWLTTAKRFDRVSSFDDAHTFSIAYALANQEYAFSPWGLSVIESSRNQDMTKHPDSLCGSLAHFMPVEDDTPELLFVKGKVLLDPFPEGLNHRFRATANLLYNPTPSYITPRQTRRPNGSTNTSYTGKFPKECLVGFGSTPLPSNFAPNLLRRRMFYLGVRMDVLSALDSCYRFNESS